MLVRWLIVIGAVFFSVQTASGIARVSDEACSQSCPDDAPDGSCPPGCNDCSCCAHLNPVVASIVLVETVEGITQDAPVISTSLPPSPEPNDILHIPKSLLA